MINKAKIDRVREWMRTALSERRSSLDKMIRIERKRLLTRTMATNQPPDEADLKRLTQLQTLRELGEKTRARPGRWLILASSLGIAATVAASVTTPYPGARLHITASAPDIVFHARYQDIFEKLSIMRMDFSDLQIEIDGRTMKGSFSIIGGQIKPQLYTYLENGTIATSHAASADSYTVRVGGPGKDHMFFVNLKGVTVAQGDTKIFVKQYRAQITPQDDVVGEISAVAKYDQPATFLEQENVEDVQFHKITRFDKGPKYAYPPGSSITSGRIDFVTIPGKSHTLYPGESFQVDDFIGQGRLQSLAVTKEGFQITYDVNVADIRTGEFQKERSIMPSYFEYYQSQQGLGVIYGTTVSLISILIGVVGFWSRRS